MGTQPVSPHPVRSLGEIGAGGDRGWNILNAVPTRVSSSRFVGRRAELTRLVACWKAAVADERAATVLIGGEAGVGKSRLVAELAARVSEPDGARAPESALVLVGQCFDLADRALPFGPIVQVLRTLHRTLDDAMLDAIVGPGREELAALLPELHAPTREGVGVGVLFEQILGVFERLSESVPTLLVIEDLHWADRSTRELFVYLARSLRNASLLLVGTYRSDDLHRRHPLRTLLVELDRSGVAGRIDLERFDRDEVRELISGIVGREPSIELVDRTYLRSDGNAFFAEELLAVEDEYGASMSPTLREIVLARVDALSEPAQQRAALRGSHRAFGRSPTARSGRGNAARRSARGRTGSGRATDPRHRRRRARVPLSSRAGPRSHRGRPAARRQSCAAHACRRRARRAPGVARRRSRSALRPARVPSRRGGRRVAVR